MNELGESAGKIRIDSSKTYRVACVHDHKTLMVGDGVVVVEAPDGHCYILRPRDNTLHTLKDASDQYVHLVERMGKTA